MYLLSCLVCAVSVLPVPAIADGGTLSQATLLELLRTEQLLAANLSEYLLELIRKYELLQNILLQLRGINEKMLFDPEVYLANPLHAFAFLRRMHEDWRKFSQFFSQPEGIAQIKLAQKLRKKLQTGKYLEVGANTLLNIQTIYNIKVNQMAAIYPHSRLNAMDCFAMGKYLLNHRQMHSLADSWFEMALDNYDYDSDNDNDLNQVICGSFQNILQALAESKFHQNLLEEAADLMDLELEYVQVNGGKSQSRSPITEKIDYFVGCRGLFPKANSQLHCRYNSKTTAFLKLAPLKLEELSREPFVVLYHDVIYDSEVRHLTNLTQKRLERSLVQEIKELKISDGRTSKEIDFTGSPDLLRNIHARISDMTGFNLEGSESLMVLNYGLGGHNDPHPDYHDLHEHPDAEFTSGDRKATVLIYLNEVKDGGFTVFPNIKLAIKPKKGAALLWHNLNEWGRADAGTIHAACPVVVGSKWVAIKWISEKAQSFTSPADP